MGFTGRHPRGGLILRKLSTTTVVARVLALGLQGLAHGLEIFRRAETGIGLIGFEQTIHFGAIDVAAFALEIGTELAARLGAFVPVQAQPAHSLVNGVHRFGRAAFGIGIFDAQYKGAAHLAGIEPVIECGSCPAHMQEARGAGRKAHPNRVGHQFPLGS